MAECRATSHLDATRFLIQQLSLFITDSNSKMGVMYSAVLHVSIVVEKKLELCTGFVKETK